MKYVTLLMYNLVNYALKFLLGKDRVDCEKSTIEGSTKHQEPYETSRAL